MRDSLTTPRIIHNPAEMLECIRKGTPVVITFTGPHWSTLAVHFRLEQVTFVAISLRNGPEFAEHTATLTSVTDLRSYLEAWERR